MNERYSLSGPEEGDSIDDSVLVIDDDGTELIEIKTGSLAKRKAIARKIAKLLNSSDAVFVN